MLLPSGPLLPLLFLEASLLLDVMLSVGVPVLLLSTLLLDALKLPV